MPQPGTGRVTTGPACHERNARAMAAEMILDEDDVLLRCGACRHLMTRHLSGRDAIDDTTAGEGYVSEGCLDCDCPFVFITEVVKLSSERIVVETPLDFIPDRHQFLPGEFSFESNLHPLSPPTSATWRVTFPPIEEAHKRWLESVDVAAHPGHPLLCAMRLAAWRLEEELHKTREDARPQYVTDALTRRNIARSRYTRHLERLDRGPSPYLGAPEYWDRLAGQREERDAMRTAWGGAA